MSRGQNKFSNRIVFSKLRRTQQRGWVAASGSPVARFHQGGGFRPGWPFAFLASAASTAVSRQGFMVVSCSGVVRSVDTSPFRPMIHTMSFSRGTSHASFWYHFVLTEQYRSSPCDRSSPLLRH